MANGRVPREEVRAANPEYYDFLIEQGIGPNRIRVEPRNPQGLNVRDANDQPLLAAFGQLQFGQDLEERLLQNVPEFQEFRQGDFGNIPLISPSDDFRTLESAVARTFEDPQSPISRILRGDPGFSEARQFFETQVRPGIEQEFTGGPRGGSFFSGAARTASAQGLQSLLFNEREQVFNRALNAGPFLGQSASILDVDRASRSEQLSRQLQAWLAGQNFSLAAAGLGAQAITAGGALQSAASQQAANFFFQDQQERNAGGGSGGIIGTGLGAVLGATAGTFLFPGVGTAAGASLGASFGGTIGTSIDGGGPQGASFNEALQAGLAFLPQSATAPTSPGLGGGDIQVQPQQNTGFFDSRSTVPQAEPPGGFAPDFVFF